jgi:hypothetical protein
MRGPRRLVAGILLMLVAGPALAEPAPPTCRMAADDRRWLSAMLTSWRQSEQTELRLAPAPLSDVYAIDASCTYRLPHGDLAHVVAVRHGGTVRLPGSKLPAAAPISFASGEGGGFFAMSLPSVWRAAGVTSTLGLDRLLDGVLLHELLHTRQTALANSIIDPVARRLGVAKDLDDDIIQHRFAKRPGYRAAYEAERDALFAAAAAPSEPEARRLASTALGRMRERRAGYFSGRDAGFATLDDVFLTMEGMGQWLAYRHALTPGGGGFTPARALAGIRRAGDQWSQDEGLALILVVHSLLPGWQALAFRDPDWRAERLLARAAGER